MNSFAIWYEGKEQSCDIDLHFNLWKLKNKSWRNSKIDDINMFLDIGLKIQKINKIKRICIFIPFTVTDENIEDLGIRMKDNRKLINGVFNDDCEIKNNSGKNGVTISRNNGNEIIKIHTLDYEYQKNIKVEPKESGSIIYINTQKDKSEKTPQSGEISSYYRFRIKGKSIYDFGIIKNDSDNPLKTSYESNHIIDFRVNEKRALPEHLNMLLQKERQFNIKVIHFLLLTDTSYKLACTGLDYTMRALEDNLWEDYIDREYEPGSLVGYHWKESKDSNKSVENFNSYIRIKETKVNHITIIIYILGVIIIGVVTNFIYSSICGQGYVNPSLCIVILIMVWITLFFYNKKT